MGDHLPMLTELYIEALLVDEALADQVWNLWDTWLISDDLAMSAWMPIGVAAEDGGCRT